MDAYDIAEHTAFLLRGIYASNALSVTEKYSKAIKLMDVVDDMMHPQEHRRLYNEVYKMNDDALKNAGIGGRR